MLRHFYITRDPDSREVSGKFRAPQGQVQMPDDHPEVMEFQQAARVSPWPPVQAPQAPRRGVVFCKRALDSDGNATGPLIDVLLEPEGERLPENHVDVVAFIVKCVRRDSAAEVKQAAQAKFNDIDSSVSKATLRSALAPFRTQLQAATTPAQIESISIAAQEAVDAL